eukprot:scaffold12093_cov137-Isochrysis_galbana.AAC.8
MYQHGGGVVVHAPQLLVEREDAAALGAGATAGGGSLAAVGVVQLRSVGAEHSIVQLALRLAQPHREHKLVLGRQVLVQHADPAALDEQVELLGEGVHPLAHPLPLRGLLGLVVRPHRPGLDGLLEQLTELGQLAERPGPDV